MPPISAEQHALHQQLTQQPPALRAERGPHRDLALPRGAAREEQVGDVRARDEQHEPDGGHEHEQGGPDVGDHLLLKRNQTHARGRQLARANAWRRSRLHALRDRGSFGFRFGSATPRLSRPIAPNATIKR